jgi:shikimate dehydrogenase
MINNDTKIFGSFSTNPGNNGNIFFNDMFRKYNINAIYKSFFSNNIGDTILSTKHLGFDGFALSSPHKINVIRYLDEIDEISNQIGACNTIINKNGKLIGYNTDWIGVNKVLPKSLNYLTIVGNGGFSKSVQYVCKKNDIQFNIVGREELDNLKTINGYVFNATPIEITTSGILIDGRPNTVIGKTIAKYQAIEQFKLYTGIEHND